MKEMGIEHVLNSRSLEFAEQLMRLTNNEGVDVVLNSLSGEFIEKSLSVLKHGGRYLEVGKTNILTAKEVEEKKPGIQYFVIELDRLMKEEPIFVQEMSREIVEGIRNNVLAPLPQNIYSVRYAEEAFRYFPNNTNLADYVKSLKGNKTTETPKETEDKKEN
jgi:NADPH:quinone reductase-like Zn-dependent oxidoreductase